MPPRPPAAEEEEEEERSEERTTMMKEEACLEEPRPEESRTICEDSHHYSFVERLAMNVARSPRLHLGVSLLLALVLSVIGFVVGEFSVAVDNEGWWSRGTFISDRQAQILMVELKQWDLFQGDEETWNEIETTVQPGWERFAVGELGLEDERRRRRRLQTKSNRFEEPIQRQVFQRLLHRHWNQRKVQESSSHCDFSWYSSANMTSTSRLWPVWKVKNQHSALDPQILQDLCLSEQDTQSLLEERGHCFGCSDQQQCLPPYSLVLYTRLLIDGGMEMDCSTLAQQYSQLNLQSITEQAFQECATAMQASSDLSVLPEECPESFYPSLLDEFFVDTGTIQYTSSIFATHADQDTLQAMYDLVPDYNKGTYNIEGAYDTQDEDFVNTLADESVASDMLLATGSAIITALAMILHTRSFFLSGIGILQIILTFPLSYFTYRFIGQLTFFPFLNFIGVFVVFALGADHVFVAVDKWKNARKDFPTLTTPQIAAKALPDAAEAMLLTTSTTAIAFFGSAICVVAPIRMFAIFNGLLISWDYILDVLLIFPSLCIYDEYREKTNCCMTCHCCHALEGGSHEIADDDDYENGDDEQNKESGESSPDEKTKTKEDAVIANPEEHHHHLLRNRYKNVDEDHKPSLIRRILLAYYRGLHKVRWPLLGGCIIAFGVCLYVATTLKLPVTAEVRLMAPTHEFEKSYAWRLHLLSASISEETGSSAAVVWGVTPADTGNHNNPKSWTQLVLDDTFDPSTTDAQAYLKDFCGSFFAQEFAEKLYPEFECPINVFDQWLQNQSSGNSTSRDNIYTQYCDRANGLPIANADTFHACLTAWAQQEEESTILSRNGIVKIIYLAYTSRVRYDSRNEDLDKEWHLTENWFVGHQALAPDEVNKAYFSSFDFWWYDTNSQMLSTALGSAAIAISASAAIILLSSRSLIMTLYSVVSVAYVLASVTAMMVASDWRLGFLESICFAILIGISVDFVIHFSHAYASLPGEVSKERRTKHALIYMGPSILAAAFTTLAAALIMLFCVILFFTKFATVLFFTIVQSLIGSFVVFLTLTDCIGPTAPTYLFDMCVANMNKDPTTNKEEDKEKTPQQAQRKEASKGVVVGGIQYDEEIEV